jgi:hypothetical protein
MRRFRSECLRSCTDVCKQKIEQLQTECGGCNETRFANFMTDAGHKLVRCGLGGDDGTGQGPRCSKLDTVLNTACCAGADGIAGNGDDTCQIPWTMPTTCHTDGTGLCAAAVQSGGAQCPDLYVSDPGRLGLYEDCGGQLSQLLAGTSVESKTAHYCDDNNPAYVDPRPNGEDPAPNGEDGTSGGGTHRALQDTTTPSPEQRVEEMFAFLEQHPEEAHRQTMVTSAVHRAPTAGTPQQAQRRALQIPPNSQSTACQQAYQEAFAATLNGGACSGGSCTQQCQKLIHDMLEACKFQTFRDPLATVDTEYSFNQKAVAALAMNGPRDCQYSLSFDSCAEFCTATGIRNVLNNDTKCANFFMGTLLLNSWNGCTDVNGKPIDDGVRKTCWKRYTTVVQKCSGCSGPGMDFVEQLLADLSEKVAADECDTCADAQETADKIQEVCCAGSDGILNTGDDPCSEHVQCVDHRRPNCSDNGGKPRLSPVPQCTNGTGLDATVIDIPGGGPCTFLKKRRNGEHTFRPAVADRCEVSRRNHSEAVPEPGRGPYTSEGSCEKTGATFHDKVDAWCELGDPNATNATNPCPVGTTCTEDLCCGSVDEGSWSPSMCNNTFHPGTEKSCSIGIWPGGDAHNKKDCEETGHVWKKGSPDRCTIYRDGPSSTDKHYDHLHCNAPDCWTAEPKGTRGSPGFVSAQEMCEKTYVMPSCNISQEFKGVHWYNPDTCATVYKPLSACKSYINALALSGKECTSTFLSSIQARRAFVDCDGNVEQLAAKGKPCGPAVFTAEYGGDPRKPPAMQSEHARAHWGSCTNHTGHLVELKSGQSCAMTCGTGFCIEGSQPHCIDGHLSWGRNDQKMACKPQEVANCQFPPNGGCDRHTTCSDTGTGLFNLKVVTCSPCPAGYFGTGRTKCNDVNECEQRVNGGCDAQTECHNTVGGYQCNPKGCHDASCQNQCPDGYNGDPFRDGGCCEDGTTYVADGEHGATCRNDGILYSLSLHSNSQGVAGFVIFVLIVVLGLLPTACVCYLCSKKQYKDSGNSFEKIDVGSIGTGPSIYDSTWAR